MEHYYGQFNEDLLIEILNAPKKVNFLLFQHLCESQLQSHPLRELILGLPYETCSNAKQVFIDFLRISFDPSSVMPHEKMDSVTKTLIWMLHLVKPNNHERVDALVKGWTRFDLELHPVYRLYDSRRDVFPNFAQFQPAKNLLETKFNQWVRKKYDK